MLNVSAFAIHAEIHKARPDVMAAAYVHSIYGKSWSSWADSSTLSPRMSAPSMRIMSSPTIRVSLLQRAVKAMRLHHRLVISVPPFSATMDS